MDGRSWRVDDEWTVSTVRYSDELSESIEQMFLSLFPYVLYPVYYCL